MTNTKSRAQSKSVGSEPMLNSDVAPEVALRSSSSSLLVDFRDTRAFTERICGSLQKEDCVLQSMTDASPVRWHLAHTTWFFETFVLGRFDSTYTSFDPQYAYLFNSYYVQAGQRFSRPDRGLLSRPIVDEIYAYRRHVDTHMADLLANLHLSSEADSDEIARIVTIGLNHEQQHQELILTDIKHAFSQNPLRPALFDSKVPRSQVPGPYEWLHIPGGLYDIGADSESFQFDNEGPRHKYFLETYEVANRPVTNAEYLEFVLDGGYRNQILWLDKAWSTVSSENWTHPIYWYEEDGRWFEFTLYGAQPLDPNAPLSHVSYYEADAYARWAGYRLPTEFEWEIFAGNNKISGHFSDVFLFQPIGTPSSDIQSDESIDKGIKIRCVFGTVWEWTRSQYTAYPGYQVEPGTLGEYNGKFMCDQFVLRGGSVATPISHIRSTYRNFFPAYARWQFSGIRLARNVR